MTGNSTNKVGISIIMPLLNEELYVEKCIKILHQHILGRNTEIIFIDGGSEDKSILLIENFSHHKLIKSKPGRAIQMNLGAKEARYPILYFLHIDSIPPKGFDQIIEEQINNGIKAGCFKCDLNQAIGHCPLQAFSQGLIGKFAVEEINHYL